MNWQHTQFDWNRARAFLAVAQEGSLTAAGKALGMSQPTLGRQISSLEHELNLILFERVGKGLMLTDAGQHLYQYVEKMAEAANDLALAAQGQNNDVVGEVCISLTEFDAFFKLPQCVETLRQVAPHIQLEVLVSNDISDLKRREADIAIRYQRPTQPDLIIKKIGTEQAFLYGHEDYVSHFKQAPIEKAAELNLIGFDHSSQMQDYLEQLGWPINQKQFVTLCKNQMVQLQLMRQGIGVGFLPDHIAKRYPELKPVFPHAFDPIELEIWLVCHTELHTNKKVRVVFDCLAEHFAM